MANSISDRNYVVQKRRDVTYVDILMDMVQRVITLIIEFFNWCIGKEADTTSQDHIWELVSQRRFGDGEEGEAPQEDAAADRGHGERSALLASGAAPVDPTAHLRELAALSVQDLGKREGLPPYLAELRHFLLNMALDLGTITYEEKVFGVEKWTQSACIKFGRWFAEFMGQLDGNFAPMTSLLQDLSRLRFLEGAALPVGLQRLLEQIRTEGSVNALVEHYQKQQLSADYKSAAERFFDMIKKPSQEVIREFWDDEIVPEAVRNRLLTDVIRQFVATPVAQFLEEVNARFNEKLPGILQRCMHDNALLIADRLFVRLQALLEAPELDFTALFDHMIELVNHQVVGLTNAEVRSSLFLAEIDRWQRADLVDGVDDDYRIRWLAALRDQILSEIAEIPSNLDTLSPEQLFRLESAFHVFNDSSIRRELDGDDRLGVVDAKLEAVGQRVPQDACARRALEERARPILPPRFLVLLLLYRNLETAEELVEAQEGDWLRFREAFKQWLIARTYMQRQEALPLENRSLGGLADRLLTLALPEQIVARPDGVVEITDGLTVLVNELMLPSEFDELFKYAIKELPRAMLDGNWDERNQEQLEGFLRHPAFRGTVDSVKGVLITRFVRPFVRDLLTNGLKAIFERLTQKEELDDLTAFNILPTVNDQLLLQLARLSVGGNVPDVALLFEEGKSSKQLADAVGEWIINHLKYSYPELEGNRLVWTRDVNEEHFREVLDRELRGFQARLEDEKSLTQASFQALLTAHFASGETAAATTVYGELVGNLLRLGHFGLFTEESVYPWLKGTVQAAFASGVQDYRRSPAALLRMGIESAREAFPERVLRLLFQGMPDELLVEKKKLLAEKGRLKDENPEDVPRTVVIERRLLAIDRYLDQYAQRREGHQPAQVHRRLDNEITLTARIAYEMIVDLARANTPWYLGGGWAGGVATGQILGADAGPLEQLIHTCYKRALGDREINEALLFRVGHAALDTLAAGTRGDVGSLPPAEVAVEPSDDSHEAGRAD